MHDTTSTVDERTLTLAADMAAEVRQLADMIAANPEVAARMRYCLRWIEEVWADALDGEPRAFLATFARAGARAGAEVVKSATDKYQSVTVRFGQHVAVKATAARNLVCERTVVGTREVTETIPDPEYIAAAPMITRTRAEDVVEWRCEPLLPGLAAASPDLAEVTP